MRVTKGIIYKTYLNDIMKRQDSLLRLHKQLSTGRRVTTPSDDPVSTGTIITSKKVIKRLDQYERNINSGLSYLSYVESVLFRVQDVLSRIKELAVSQATDTASAETRQASASEISNLFDELVSLGNASIDDRFVFSGYETSTTPFTSTGQYQGDSNNFQLKVAENTVVTIGFNGGEVFKGSGGGVDIFQIVSDLITDLNNDDSTGIQNAIGSLESAFQQISNTISDTGGRIVRLNAIKEDLSDFRFDLEITVSNLEDADITEVISSLKLGEIALEASLNSAARILNTNIFNYI